jgi:hypothetical protein
VLSVHQNELAFCGRQFVYHVEILALADENSATTNIGVLKGKGKYGDRKRLTSTLAICQEFLSIWCDISN